MSNARAPKSPAHLRNVAIIAHVDHGKTTLIDAMLRQSGVFNERQEVVDCVMDSNELERERGITIFSKNASIWYQDIKINIVDTPGHADFGGEVERILQMVNGVLLLVDAAEGPLPQTRFVLKKSLERGLKAIVIVNKIDRPDAQPHDTLNKIFDLFMALGATDEQADFPVLYASSRQGYAIRHMEDPRKDLQPLFETIVEHVPAEHGDPSAPLQLLVTTTDYSDYLGRIAIGKVTRGTIHADSNVAAVRLDGSVTPFHITALYGYDGMVRVDTDAGLTGDIAALTGLGDIRIGETVTALDRPEPLQGIPIDDPTLTMVFSVNDSPFAGREGKFVTSRHIQERLHKEALTNLSLRVEETDSPEALRVSGRGELHLGILIETMRREGYEFQVSKPEVILKEGGGQTLEPYEQLILDIPSDSVGTCIEKLGARKGDMVDMTPVGEGRTRLEYQIPTRCLMGFRSEFIIDTRGEGLMHRIVTGYQPYKGEMRTRTRGVIVAFEDGSSTAYAIYNAQDRGVFFIEARVPVYQGMIVGENNRSEDIEVNVCKEKHLSNMRSKAADEALTLVPARDMSLEQCLEYVAADELMEVTPKSLRLRKRLLDPRARKRATEGSPEGTRRGGSGTGEKATV